MSYLVDDLGNSLVGGIGELLTDDIDNQITATLYGLGLTVASPIFAQPIIMVSTAILGSRVIDFGLQALASEANAFYVCLSMPAIFDDITNVALGIKAGAIFAAPSAAAGGGRKASLIAFLAGNVIAGGIVTAWAVADTVNARLLAAGPVLVSQGVSFGGTFGVATFDLAMRSG